MDKQLKDLREQVEQLNKRVAFLEQRAGIAVPPEPRQGQTPSTFPAESSNSLQAADKPSLSQKLGTREELLAGAWFNRLGILAIMLAVAFFIKWSFDNNLIGELGRIVIGIIIGLGFLAGGEYFQRRKYPVYGQGFTGGGIGILYFSIYAAFIFYQLISQPVAFAFMVLITLAASLLAVRYNSPVIGIIGIVGGFATPFVLSTGQANRTFLYTYIAILDLGVLLIAYYKKWLPFNYLTFVLTYFSYEVALYSAGSSSSLRNFDLEAFLYVTVFFLIYLGISFIQTIRMKDRFHSAEILLMVLNALLYFWASFQLLDRHFHPWIGYWAVLLAVVYLAMGLIIYRLYPPSRRSSLVALVIAAFFLTVAVPLQLNGHWITISWAVEAVIVVYLCLRINPEKAPVLGLVILAVAVVSAVLRPFNISGQEAWIFLNKAAVAYLAVIIATGMIIRLFGQKTANPQTGGSRKLMSGLQITMNLLIILFFTREITAYYQYQVSVIYKAAGHQSAAVYRETSALLNRKDLILSLVWGLHAAVVIILGFWRRLRGPRLFGLAFLVFVIFKVFFYDLSSLSTPNRILSFLALGVILLMISWLYHRYKEQIMGEGEGDG